MKKKIITERQKQESFKQYECLMRIMTLGRSEEDYEGFGGIDNFIAECLESYKERFDELVEQYL